MNKTYDTLGEGFEINTKFFSLKVLTCIYELQVFYNYLSGASLEEIVDHMSKRFVTDGDLNTQVDISLRQICHNGLVGKSRGRYKLVGPMARIVLMSHGKSKRDAQIRRIQKNFHTTTAKNPCCKVKQSYLSNKSSSSWREKTLRKLTTEKKIKSKSKNNKKTTRRSKKISEQEECKKTRTRKRKKSISSSNSSNDSRSYSIESHPCNECTCKRKTSSKGSYCKPVSSSKNNCTCSKTEPVKESIFPHEDSISNKEYSTLSKVVSNESKLYISSQDTINRQQSSLNSEETTGSCEKTKSSSLKKKKLLQKDSKNITGAPANEGDGIIVLKKPKSTESKSVEVLLKSGTNINSRSLESMKNSSSKPITIYEMLGMSSNDSISTNSSLTETCCVCQYCGNYANICECNENQNR